MRLEGARELDGARLERFDGVRIRRGALLFCGKLRRDGGPLLRRGVALRLGSRELQDRVRHRCLYVLRLRAGGCHLVRSRLHRGGCVGAEATERGGYRPNGLRLARCGGRRRVRLRELRLQRGDLALERIVVVSGSIGAASV